MTSARGQVSEGAVYVIGPVDARVVKIGWSRDPEARLRALQVGQPEKWMLHSFVPGSREVEKGLHEEFADLHIRGEWFANTDNDILDVFAGLREHFWPELCA